MDATMTTDKAGAVTSPPEKFDYGWSRPEAMPYILGMARVFGGRLDSQYAVQEFLNQAWPSAVFMGTLTSNGQPAGYVAGTVRGPHILHIDDLLVVPAYRRQGVARRLLSGLLQGTLATSVRTVTMDVPEDNLGLQLFLKALGFRWLKTTGATYLMAWNRPKKSPPR